jgi:hypothetical protein
MAPKTAIGIHKAKKTTKSSNTKIKRQAKPIVKIGTSSGLKLPTEDIRRKLLSYADEIQQYLGKVNAKVDFFDFAVEKSNKGLIVICEVKAIIAI